MECQRNDVLKILKDVALCLQSNSPCGWATMMGWGGYPLVRVQQSDTPHSLAAMGVNGRAVVYRCTPTHQPVAARDGILSAPS